ncbi:MAG: nucleoside hydrolase [Trueperaceae bacterium]|nr:nucleoside hydrolase [Trueperaceae bacterium]
MTKPRIILDCDPGHDDAIALLLAGHRCDILGVTPVSGNVPLELTSHNALITTQILDLDVPVHAGVERPLVAKARHAEFIHGETGLGGPTLPERQRELASADAVSFIVDTVRANDDVRLVATGPLTNVALALRQAPDIAQKLAGISIMGGGTNFGNVTPSAEFNIWADPEAARVVFESGATLRMCGLNLTHQWMIGPEQIAQIRDIDNAAAHFVADMLDFYCNAYAEAFFAKPEGPLHDPCAVLVVTHPELFEFRERHVAVELRGEYTRGMTVVDERGLVRRERTDPPNVQVAYAIDAERAFALLHESIASYTD